MMFFHLALILVIQSVFVECKDLNITKQSKDFKFLLAQAETITWKENIARTFVSFRPRNPEEYFGDNHFCAGVILSRKHVLTSAICVVGKGKIMRRSRNIIAVAGWPRRLLYSFEMVKRIRAFRVTVHQMFVLRNSDNIAIIQLEKPFPMAVSAINIATMPTKKAETNASCLVIGWGRRYKDGPLAGEIKSIELTIQSDEECVKLIDHFRIGDEICAVDKKKKAMTPCPGDMGAPLFCNDVLYGITSTTDGCQKIDPVSRFTDVFAHKDWIVSSMNTARPNLKLPKGQFVGAFFFCVLSLFSWGAVFLNS